jgi:transcription initiation factor TFIIIB Brf1 subunit/transcription initiation factor TFIIB
MQDNSANSRDFNSMSVAGLSDEARQAVNTAFDAMSAWRINIANSNEKNSEQVIEKMAAAARALGWPEQIVDATSARKISSNIGGSGLRSRRSKQTHVTCQEE